MVTGGKFTVGVVDNGGIFATGVIDTISVVHLDFWISLRLFEKILYVLKVISEVWGKTIHEKNLKPKILWHSPFKVRPKTLGSFTEHKGPRHSH